MNILVDISHPGHVHLFKNLIFRLQDNNHEIIVTIKDIPIVKSLLKHYQIEYINLGRKSSNIFGKGIYQLLYLIKVFTIVKHHNIEIGIGSSIIIAQVSFLTNMHSIILDDDDDNIEPLFVKFGHRFSDCVLSPDCIERKTQRNISYRGYHELAYLHPSIFTPDPDILKKVGVDPEEVFFIFRFVALKGHHDMRHRGITKEQKLELIGLLSQYGRVFVTSEEEKDSEFIKYQLPISTQYIHTLMYYATMFLGDSQTMTTESAVLGTPALKCNSFATLLSVPNELENIYHLCFSYQPDQFEEYKDHIVQLLSNKDLKQLWHKRRVRLFQDKINTTEFLLWYVEHYPESMSVVTNNSEFQNRFISPIEV